MTNSPRLEEPLSQAAAQGRRSPLANGYYSIDLELKHAPGDSVMAAKERMAEGRASNPAPSSNGHTAHAAHHHAAEGNGHVAVTPSLLGTSDSLPDRLSGSSSSPESAQTPSTGRLAGMPMPLEDASAAEQHGTGAGSTGQQPQQQRPQPVLRTSSGGAPRPSTGTARRPAQAFGRQAYQQGGAPSYSFPDTKRLQQQQRYWGLHAQSEADVHAPRLPGSNGVHHGYMSHEEGYGPQGVGMYPMYAPGAQLGTLPPPVLYTQQQYAQQFPQGQYMMYGGGMVPPGMMGMQYMSGLGQYEPHHSPPHGSMRAQTAQPIGSPPGAPYGLPYPPMLPGQSEYAGGFYTQAPAMQHLGPDGAMYYGGGYAPEHYGPSIGGGYPGSNPVPIVRPKGGRGSALSQQQPFHFGIGPLPFPVGQKPSPPDISSGLKDPSRHRRQASGSSGADAEREFSYPVTPTRARGHRRQFSSPADMQDFRPPRKSLPDSLPPCKGRGHRRHFSLPGNVDFGRVQSQKLGEAGGRRHRRARSDEAKAALEEPRAASILEDFKSNRTQAYTLEDIRGYVYDFCKDQFGSRFIQQKLETATPQEVEAVFDEVCGSKEMALALMCDVFGNYVVQKFLEHGTPSQRSRLAAALRGSVKHLSTQMYGCRVIQKAIEVLSLEEQVDIVSELQGQIIECVADQNGNHVIQKCIECIKPSANIQFVLDELAGTRPGSASAARRTMLLPSKIALVPGWVALSRHPYGCRVVQRILEHCDIAAFKQDLLRDVKNNALDLSRDTYGNYVIQHSLQHGDASQRSAVICKLQGHIVGLSQHKFASNVIEKCLQYGNRDQRRAMVCEMLGANSGLEGAAADELLHQMMKDQYGNYVVQKTLEALEKLHGNPIQRKFMSVLLHLNERQCFDLYMLLKFKPDQHGGVCTEAQREVLLDKIQRHLAQLKKLTYGKHIVSRVEKLLINAAAYAKEKAAEEAAKAGRSDEASCAPEPRGDAPAGLPAEEPSEAAPSASQATPAAAGATPVEAVDASEAGAGTQ